MMTCNQQRAPKSAAQNPVVDLAVVYGTQSFRMGSGFDTIAFPEELNHLFLSTLFLCIKRKVSPRVTQRNDEALRPSSQ